MTNTEAVVDPRTGLPRAGESDLFPLRLACRIGFKLYFAHCEVRGEEHLPSGNQGYILALNHHSMLDPGLVWSYFPDPVYFVYREDYGGFDRIPLLGWAARELGQIAIKREGGDVKGIRRAIRYLTEEHRRVGIFVEGTRSSGRALNPGKHGCALIAARSGAPVIPCYMSGLGVAYPRGAMIPRYVRKLSIDIGAPFEVVTASSSPTKEELETNTRRIVASIEALAPDSPETQSHETASHGTASHETATGGSGPGTGRLPDEKSAAAGRMKA